MSPPPTKKSRWAKVPRAVLLAAQEAAGGEDDERVQEHPEEGLWRIRCAYGDPVYDVVIGGWVIAASSPGLAEEDHTQLIASFSPPPHVRHTLLCPPETSACNITREAASVAHHYAVAYATLFRGGGNSSSATAHPPLPLLPAVDLGPPLNPQPLYVKIPNAKGALPALLHRIRTLNATDYPHYPLISRLPLGSYICDIAILWSNAGQTIALFKA
jgi:hypothetical protein